MAPITRSSIHGRPSGRSQQATDSYVSTRFGDTEGDDEAMADDYDDGEHIIQDPVSSHRPTTQESLRSLQDTANRVTKQVEAFAKALDKFVISRDATDQALWDDALVLLETYSDISANYKTEISTSDPNPRAEQTQFEADLWILVKTLLDGNSPAATHNEKIAQESRLVDLNRYSNDSSLWEAFLDSDHHGQDYESILDWLQGREAAAGIPMEELVRLLNEKSQRGEGVWSAGPMYTQAAVKKQKRSRGLSVPLDPSLSGLKNIHARPSDGQPLVAQLDPDAQTREQAVLQEQDESHELAAWRTYWEMLRRGQGPEQIQAWWAERKENWRYAVLRGGGLASSKMGNSPWIRMMKIASNPEWFDRCEALSQDDSLNEYQRAVYGIIVGNVSSSDPVNQTIDDHLFAIFNSLLIERYQLYLRAYKTKLADLNATTYRPTEPSSTLLSRFFVEALATDEIRQPHKFLQLAVVSKDFTTFLLTMGQAAAQVAHATGRGKHLMRNNTALVSEVAQISARDPDTTRFVAHLQLTLKSLGILESSYTDNEYEFENNIVNYIRWLESEGKFTLIPVYVSKLSKKRGEHVLAAVLVNVTDHKERELQIKLMKQYKLDISAVAHGVFSLANYDEIQDIRTAKGPLKAQRITEPSTSDKVGQVRIKRGLMAGEPSPDEEKAIQSVEWYHFVDAERWGSAAWSVALLYKIFLSKGRFQALRVLLTRVSLAEVSLDAVGMNLNFADQDPPTENGTAGDDEMDEDQVHSISPTRKRKSSTQPHVLTRDGTDRATLAQKSRIWKELEQLVAAIDALEGFQDLADDIEHNRGNANYVRQMKRELRRALEEVELTIQHLLDPAYLCHPQDEVEGVFLREIRNLYIPECILGYNSALYFAGYSLSRAHLIETMELAQIVAQNQMLTNAFLESGRMKELVRAFALDSQALLLANQQTGGKGAKRTKSERGNPDIWNVAWKDDEVDLEAMD